MSHRFENWHLLPGYFCTVRVPGTGVYNNYSVVPAAAQMAAQFTDVETSKRYELFDLAGLTVGAYKEGTNDTDLPTTIKQDPEAELILHKAKEVHVKSEPEAEF